MSAKKTSAKTESSEPLFIGIAEPVEIRRILLETSRDFLLLLKKIEEVKLIRAKKDADMKSLSSILKDIKSSLASLKKILPSASVAKAKAPKKKVVKKLSSAEPEIVIPPVKKTEIQKLEHELAEIEQKLSSI